MTRGKSSVRHVIVRGQVGYNCLQLAAPIVSVENCRTSNKLSGDGGEKRGAVENYLRNVGVATIPSLIQRLFLHALPGFNFVTKWQGVGTSWLHVRVESASPTLQSKFSTLSTSLQQQHIF